jgi:hypothetical protein
MMFNLKTRSEMENLGAVIRSTGATRATAV